jgi:transketolase
MGMADMAVALWGRHLRHNPAHPQWPDRDRFVLSNGHGSMLIYALLHLTGYELPMSELRSFRQLHSKTPGHPEVGMTPGVETTTGPLGQGVANAVGMALAEKLLAHEFNRRATPIVDHRTYVTVGDGDLMEGVSHEACALAGAWRLGKLVVLYDDNGISIDGEVDPWYVDDAGKRFEAYGWNVIGPVDGHDIDAVDAAIGKARQGGGQAAFRDLQDQHRPRFAEPRRHRQGARRGARRRRGEAHAGAPVVVPRAVRAAGGGLRVLGRARCRRGGEDEWKARFAAYRQDTRRWPRSSSAAWPASCRSTSRRPRSTPPSRPMRRPIPWPRARPARSRSKPSRRRCPR